MANPTKFTWVDPTLNTDGSAITAGEITGYLIGIRTGGVAGTYPITASVAGATAASELLSALGTVLAPNNYSAAIQTVGPVNSAWSSEVTFTIAPSQPNPPTGFSVS